MTHRKGGLMEPEQAVLFGGGVLANFGDQGELYLKHMTSAEMRELAEILTQAANDLDEEFKDCPT